MRREAALPALDDAPPIELVRDTRVSQTVPLSAVSAVRVSNVDKKSEPGELPVRLCNYTDVYKNEYITNDLEFMHATASRAEVARFALRPGDVIITKDSETPDDIGIPSLVDNATAALVCGYHLAMIRPCLETIDPTFLAKQLAQPRIARYFGQQANGSTRYGLSITSVENTPIWLPSIGQQRKIGAIARLLDRAIGRVEELIAKLARIRLGLLEDLMVRDVDVFRSRPLSSIANVSFSSVDKITRFGEAPVRLCNYIDVYTRRYITADLPFMRASATRTEIARFGLQVGDVIITKDSETPDDIGVPTIVDGAAPDIVCGYHLALIRPNRECVDPTFLSLQFAHSRLKSYFGRQATGTTRYGLSTKGIEQAPILDLPVREQESRSSIMRRHDHHAAQIDDELAKLRALRVSLMADLFSGRTVTPDAEIAGARR